MKSFIRCLFLPLFVVCGTGIFSSVALATTAAPPIFILGEACPNGSVKSHSWQIVEDLDGNGLYDWVVQGDCNGLVSGHPFGSSIQSDPVGLSPDAGSTYWEFDYTYLPAVNRHIWELVERRSSDGTEVCRVGRNTDGELYCTCPYTEPPGPGIE